MCPPGDPGAISGASRGRKPPALCDHSITPVLVSAVPGGWQTRCLVCGTLGPVREASEAAGVGPSRPGVVPVTETEELRSAGRAELDLLERVDGAVELLTQTVDSQRQHPPDQMAAAALKLP